MAGFGSKKRSKVGALDEFDKIFGTILILHDDFEIFPTNLYYHTRTNQSFHDKWFGAGSYLYVYTIEPQDQQNWPRQKEGNKLRGPYTTRIWRLPIWKPQIIAIE